MDFTTGGGESPVGDSPELPPDPSWVSWTSQPSAGGPAYGAFFAPPSVPPQGGFLTPPAGPPVGFAHPAASRSGRRRAAGAAALATLTVVALVSVANAKSPTSGSTANPDAQSSTGTPVSPSWPGRGMFVPGSPNSLGGTDQGSAAGQTSTPATDTGRARVGRGAGAAAARAVTPGLVDINTRIPGGVGAGTGIVLTDSGEVLTNNHVIDGARSITATDLSDGRTYRAVLVGTDPTHDIAVLRLIGATGLPTATISDTPAKVGDTVVGVGNGEGAGTPNWALGTVTALNRGITATDETGGNPERVTGMIQSTTGILPGDSGGPLVDLTGQVVGMDTAGAFAKGHTNSAAQTAFSIPIAEALTIANRLAAANPAAGGGGLLGLPI